MVVFPLVKKIKGNPVEIGTKIGEYLVENMAEVSKFNVVAGFLNLVISDKYYLEYFNSIKNSENFGFVTPTEGEKAVMVEYSSPNTNKPLHLGHVRNNLLGYSVAEIINNLCFIYFFIELVTNIKTFCFSSNNVIKPKYPILFSGNEGAAINFTHSICPKCVGYPNICIYNNLATFL